MNARIAKLSAAVMLLLWATNACTSETKYGECIGLFDEGDPGLVYTMPVMNVVAAIGCAQTLIVPAWVVAKESRCPTAVKVKREKGGAS